MLEQSNKEQAGLTEEEVPVLLPSSGVRPLISNIFGKMALGVLLTGCVPHQGAGRVPRDIGEFIVDETDGSYETRGAGEIPCLYEIQNKKDLRFCLEGRTEEMLSDDLSEWPNVHRLKEKILADYTEYWRNNGVPEQVVDDIESVSGPYLEDYIEALAALDLETSEEIVDKKRVKLVYKLVASLPEVYAQGGETPKDALLRAFEAEILALEANFDGETDEEF